jgi:hypothetical protein
MQDNVPMPQRAWLYLPKDPILVHYARQIKSERDHVLEDIISPGQRDLFGRVTVSTNEYMPLTAFARVDALIGEEDGRDESDEERSGDTAISLYEQKRDLRDLHRLLVGSVARKSAIDHRQLNAELIARTGSRVDQVTTEQLQKRIQLLEKWQERGYDGKR